MGNQMMLRLAAQRAAVTGSQTRPAENDGDQARMTGEGAAPGRPERLPAPSHFSATRLPGPIQAQLDVGAVDDPLEREADLVADRVTRMPGPEVPAATAPPQIGRKQAAGPTDGLKKQPAGPQAVAGEAPAIVQEVLRSPGQPLDEATQSYFGPRFGYDFGGVRVHADGQAARSTRAIAARAYTAGRHIVFDLSRYQPTTVSGRRLLAHELTHVIQQGDGRHVPGTDRSSTPDTPKRLQRDYGGDSPTGCSDPNALIPIADFIRYVEAVERGYPNDTPEEILTRIRTEYYRGLAFEALIPNAPYDVVIGKRTTYSHGDRWDLPTTAPRRLEESAIGAEAYQHLTAHADEDALGDNPSPYIVMPNGAKIDVGHVLLGLDALLHPGPRGIYTNYGVPNIDPSSWVADLGIAAVWMTTHERTGKPDDRAPNPPSTPDLDVYYAKSAPEADLLGDADSFGAKAQWDAASNQHLSQVMRSYYLGTGATSRQRRFQLFCSANGFTYTRNKNTITWDPALRDQLATRINRFNDLYAAGKWGVGWHAAWGTEPPHEAWPYTPKVVDKFLGWVKTNLEAELAGSTGT